ncbi:hypothetical protein AGMMS49949_06520 [Alphaproteobacteria bacterium]|nr:hypothetical protein AGMMS49949_06520 [Alphaproteobacteria bacterium]GHS98376.1 hypothetical protein AGMMS50296_6000 [Alphaproteobacteria bacterium]
MFPTHPKDLALIESLVRYAAKKLKRHPILSQETEDDLFQDLYVFLLESWQNYDSEKGTMQQFTRCILKRKSFNILRNHCRHKKPNQQFQVLWDERVWETLEAPDGWEQQERTLEIKKKLMRLPRHLRLVAEQLKEKAPYRLSKDWKIPRAQVSQSIQQIRPYFEEFSSDFLVPQRGRSTCISL